AMKRVGGRLRLDLAQFRELEAFAGFGSDLDRASQLQIARGQRLVEVLKQPQYSPVPVEDQVVQIFAGTAGLMDDIPVGDVQRFISGLVEFVHARFGDVTQGIAENGKFPDEVREKLERAVNEFKAGFQKTETPVQA